MTTLVSSEIPSSVVVPPSPLLSSTHDKLALSAKVKELASHIHGAIKRGPAATASPKRPGLISAASILLAAQLEGVPLKSLGEICNATGLPAAELQEYYKQLVGHLGALLPPNYIPASKVRLYRKMSVDPTQTLPGSFASPASPTMTSLSLSSHTPDLCAAKFGSLAQGPGTTMPIPDFQKSGPSFTPPAPISLDAPPLSQLQALRRASVASLPPSPSLAARRGSLCTEANLTELLGVSAPGAAYLIRDQQGRRTSLGLPGSPSLTARKIAVQISANSGDQPGSIKKTSARAAAAVMASLASLDATDMLAHRKHMIEEARTTPNTPTCTFSPPPPAPTPMSLLGRRNSSYMLDSDSSRTSGPPAVFELPLPFKRSKIGIRDMLCQPTSHSTPTTPISSTPSLEALRINSPSTHTDSDSETTSGEDETSSSSRSA